MVRMANSRKWLKEGVRQHGLTAVAVPLARVVRVASAPEAPVVLELGALRIEVRRGVARETLAMVLETLVHGNGR